MSDRHAMISRHWRGLCKRELADRYVAHLRLETFPQLVTLPGFIRATILRRELLEGTEFQVVTLWKSLEAIKAFAGDDIEVAVVPRSVEAMMLSYERSAAHYEVVDTVSAPREGGA